MKDIYDLCSTEVNKIKIYQSIHSFNIKDYYSLINLLNFCDFHNCIAGIRSKSLRFLGTYMV